MDGQFTIGGLAGRAGVNLQTVRYYERRGLISPVGRKESGYRLYNADTLKRLKFIRRSKELGFTLEEIRGLLDLRIEPAQSKDVCNRVKAKTSIKLTIVEEKLKTLNSVRKVLKGLLDACDRRSPTEQCPILKAMEKKEDCGQGA